MAWKFTIHQMKASHALSVIDINDNFTEIIDEMGSLGEHNWDAGAFYRVPPDGFDINEGFTLSAAYGINQTAVTKDPNDDLIEDFGQGHSNPETAIDPNGLGFKVPETGMWERVPCQTGPIQSLPLEITSRGGLIWIMASFQHSSHTNWVGFPMRNITGPGTASDTISNYPFTGSGTFYWNRLALNELSYGVEYALAIDGAIIPESILGSGENTTQDQFDLRVRKDSADQPLGHVRGTTPGCWGERLPCVTEAIISIAPGNHTIELLARCRHIELEDGTTPNAFPSWLTEWGGVPANKPKWTSVPKNWCTNRELIVLELMR